MIALLIACIAAPFVPAIIIRLVGRHDKRRQQYFELKGRRR